MAKRKKVLPTAKFTVGAKVRVRAGTTDPDFPDIPIGGWAGSVKEIESGQNPPTCLVHWNPQTLANIHPVYRNRCERDGLEIQEMWLGEGDLEPDDDGPIVFDQPSNIVVRPLDLNDQEDRIRLVFGLTSDDPLPEVDEAALGRYHSFLSSRLSFPCEATFSQETGPFSSKLQTVSVLGLCPADEADDRYGLMCDARIDRRVAQLPLCEVEPKKGNPNRASIADYSFWFVNWA